MSTRTASGPCRRTPSKNACPLRWRSASIQAEHSLNISSSSTAAYLLDRDGYQVIRREQVSVEDYLVTITQTDGRRIGQLHFKKLAGVSRSESNTA